MYQTYQDAVALWPKNGGYYSYLTLCNLEDSAAWRHDSCEQQPSSIAQPASLQCTQCEEERHLAHMTMAALECTSLYLTWSQILSSLLLGPILGGNLGTDGNEALQERCVI